MLSSEVFINFKNASSNAFIIHTSQYFVNESPSKICTNELGYAFSACVVGYFGKKLHLLDLREILDEGQILRRNSSSNFLGSARNSRKKNGGQPEKGSARSPEATSLDIQTCLGEPHPKGNANPYSGLSSWNMRLRWLFHKQNNHNSCKLIDSRGSCSSLDNEGKCKNCRVFVGEA